jgi:flagellar basal-body rod protein FlgB
MTSVTRTPVLMQMLNTQMVYTTERQGVLAHNMANVDTPNFAARDLKKLDFENMARMQRLEMTITSPVHSNGTLNEKMRIADEKVRKPFEMSPQKNTVVLEEQMAKVSDNSTQFQMSSSLLKKYTQLYRAATGSR